MKLPGDPCAVCRRSAGEVQLHIVNRPLVQLCSTECARLYMNAANTIRPDETEACKKGGEEAGAYLDAIGKTDLASMTPAEWQKFCAILFTATCADLRRQADDEIPF